MPTVTPTGSRTTMLMVSPGTSSVSPCWSWTMPAYSSKVWAASSMSTRESSSSLPICMLSRRAKSSARSRRSAAARLITSARSTAFIFGHGPLSKASRAARTASSASATPAFGTWAIASSDAGSTTS